MCIDTVEHRACDQVPRRANGAVREPIVVDGVAVQVGMGIGVAAPVGRSLHPLLRGVDVAPYRAKAAGPGVARCAEGQAIPS